MDKQSIVSAIKNKLYWMGSEFSPSFKDVNMYDFIDRAYHIVIGQNVVKGKLEYLDKLIVTGNNINYSYDPLKDRYMKVLNTYDDFFLFIGGTVLMKVTGGIESTSGQNIALEQVSIEYLEILTDDKNLTYFRNPKIMFGDENASIFIVPSYYARIQASQTCLTFRYISIPERFKDMAEDEEPVISKLLHLDIVEKAAELISNTLNPSVAAQEIQNNNQISL